MEMIRLHIHEKCMEQMFGLPKGIQKKVLDFHKKFRQDSKSAAIHLEPISTFKDNQLRTARIDQKYRAIVRVPESGQDYYLLWVDNHDEAMDWARNKTFVWNEYTNAAQIFDEPIYTEPTATQPFQSKPPLFADFSDEQLMAIGVPEQLLFLVKDVIDYDGLGSIEKNLPPDAFENLFYLADGANIQSLINEVREGATATTDSINNRRSFVVVDEQLLEEYFNGDLSKWQLFLHPTQRKLVETDFKGSVKVTGGGGTGKTVVALHRLKKIVVANTSGRPVLFTTFTNALTENLKDLIRKMQVPETGYILRNIDALARELAVKAGILQQKAMILDMPGMETARGVWSKVLETRVSEYDEAFLDQEYQQVWLYHGIQNPEEYYKVSRLGRGKPLSRKQKMDIAELVLAYNAYKQHNSMFDRAELFNRLAEVYNQQEQKPFAAIIADEVQDMSNVELRFLRSLTEERENDMFLVGDPYQKIYSRKINFAAAGIHVRGTRSKRLRINYRTTEEIKRLAISTIRNFRYDDFDGEAETIDGYLSLVHGSRPEYKLFKTEGEEIAFIIEAIKELSCRGQQFQDMVIGCRKKELLREIKSALHQAVISYYDLSEKTGNQNGVRLSTFHSLKGLEFKTVFLAGVNSQTAPLQVSGYNDWEPGEQEAYLQSERSLLYVAMTRAMQHLVITGTGVKSGLVQA